MTRRILITLAAAAVLPLTAWAGWYDFDSRGFWQAYLFLWTAIVAALTWGQNAQADCWFEAKVRAKSA